MAKAKVVNAANARTDEMLAMEADGLAAKIGAPDRGLPPASAAGKQVVIERVQWAVVPVPIRGLSPFIMHAFGPKAMKKMLDDQTQEKVQAGRKKREPRNVQSEYEDGFYYIGPRENREYGFPAFSFKRCMVGACRQVEDLPMTVACTLFHVMADDLSTGLVRLGAHSEPVQREDVVRLQTGVASLAFRPQFDQWGFDLRLRFNPKVISLQSLVNLLELAGSACGIGDWRPERKGGPFGMFEIDGERFGQQQKAA